MEGLGTWYFTSPTGDDGRYENRWAVRRSTVQTRASSSLWHIPLWFLIPDTSSFEVPEQNYFKGIWQTASPDKIFMLFFGFFSPKWSFPPAPPSTPSPFIALLFSLLLSYTVTDVLAVKEAAFPLRLIKHFFCWASPKHLKRACGSLGSALASQRDPQPDVPQLQEQAADYKWKHTAKVEGGSRSVQVQAELSDGKDAADEEPDLEPLPPPPRPLPCPLSVSLASRLNFHFCDHPKKMNVPLRNVPVPPHTLAFWQATLRSAPTRVFCASLADLFLLLLFFFFLFPSWAIFELPVLYYFCSTNLYISSISI